MLILPAIDVIGGRCVRLTQGDYARATVYDLDPVEVAKQFEAEGAEWLHVVDLDGARLGEPQNLVTLGQIAWKTKLKVEFGGGLRSQESVERVFDSGAARVVLGTALIRDPDFATRLFQIYGDRVVAGIDARNGQVAVHGWQEASSVSGLDLARRLVDLGCRRIITTDVETDGAFTGPNLGWLRSMVEAVPIPVIASGGVRSVEDVVRLWRDLPQVEGVIVGKALYEGHFTLAEALGALSGAQKSGAHAT